MRPLIYSRQSALVGLYLASLVVAIGFVSFSVHGFVASLDRVGDDAPLDIAADHAVPFSVMKFDKRFTQRALPAPQLPISPSPEASGLFAALRATPAIAPTAHTVAVRESRWRRGGESAILPELPEAEMAVVPRIRDRDFWAPLAVCDDEHCMLDRRLGTTIDWYADREEASELAREQDKLLVVMCISGDFEKPEFT